MAAALGPTGPSPVLIDGRSRYVTGGAFSTVASGWGAALPHGPAIRCAIISLSGRPAALVADRALDVG